MSEWLQRNDGEEKDDGEAGQQDIQRDLIRSFLTLRPLYESNHAIEKGLAWIGCDANRDLVAQHPRTSGHRGAVTACFANDRSGLARDSGFIDGCHTVDYLAVTRNHLPGGDAYHILCAKLGTRHLLNHFRPDAIGNRLRFRLAQCIGLCFAASFGHGLRKICKEHREPEPERDLQIESSAAEPTNNIRYQKHRGEDTSHFNDEHDWIAHHRDGIQLAQSIHCGSPARCPHS